MVKKNITTILIYSNTKLNKTVNENKSEINHTIFSLIPQFNSKDFSEANLESVA